MFDFKLSPQLAAKICSYLYDLRAFRRRANSDEIEVARAVWGKGLVGALGMEADRTRYEPATQFVVITDRVFAPEFSKTLESGLPIPEGKRGDELVAEVAKEFLEWARANAATLALHPRAPLTRFEVQGRDVIAHVRPADPPVASDGFVRAVEIE